MEPRAQQRPIKTAMQVATRPSLSVAPPIPLEVAELVKPSGQITSVADRVTSTAQPRAEQLVPAVAPAVLVAHRPQTTLVAMQLQVLTVTPATSPVITESMVLVAVAAAGVAPQVQ